MPKKRIIFTVTTDLNHDQRMHRICASLQNDGFEVLLVGRKLSNSKKLQERSFRQKRLTCWFNTSVLFYIEYNLRLLFLLANAKVDIYAPVDLDTILPSYILQKWRRKEIVFDAHEYFTELPELNGRKFVKKIWEFIADITLPNITNAYTVNHSLAQLFTEKYGVPYQYVRNITSQFEKFETNSRDKKIILYQGAINVGRGLENAIDVMQYLDDCTLEIAGEGGIINKLKRKVQTSNLENKVVFLGQLSPKALALKTSEAYIGLNLLSTDSLNYYYSLANKFFDYMHAGVPSINMNFPEYRYINESYEVAALLPELNNELLLTTINKMLSDKKYYETLKCNANSAKKYFTWQIEEQKLLKLYNKI